MRVSLDSRKETNPSTNTMFWIFLNVAAYIGWKPVQLFVWPIALGWVVVSTLSKSFWRKRCSWLESITRYPTEISEFACSMEAHFTNWRLLRSPERSGCVELSFQFLTCEHVNFLPLQWQIVRTSRCEWPVATYYYVVNMYFRWKIVGESSAAVRRYLNRSTASFATYLFCAIGSLSNFWSQTPTCPSPAFKSCQSPSANWNWT